MMTLIKRTALQARYIMETPPTVQEIHDDFDTMTQRAVAEVRAILNPAEHERMTKRVEALKAAGFVNMPEIKEYSVKRTEYFKAKAFLDAAEKYAQKYPQYKFVSIAGVVEICKKYGLMCAPVGKYKGDVPQKNLDEIAAFKVAPEDTYFEKWSRSDRNQADITNPSAFVDSPIRIGYDTSSQPVTKFICAPNDHFEIDKEDKVFGEVFITRFIKDPIVLHFVKDGFLVVSKWGTEASDPIVLNEKMN